VFLISRLGGASGATGAGDGAIPAGGGGGTFCAIAASAENAAAVRHVPRSQFAPLVITLATMTSLPRLNGSPPHNHAR
jgi:hypothetical protein